MERWPPFLRNQLTFWLSHLSRGQSRNIQGTDKGNHYALKSRIPLIKRELTLSESCQHNHLPYDLSVDVPLSAPRPAIGGRSTEWNGCVTRPGSGQPDAHQPVHLHGPEACCGRQEAVSYCRERVNRDQTLYLELLYPVFFANLFMKSSPLEGLRLLPGPP